MRRRSPWSLSALVALSAAALPSIRAEGIADAAGSPYKLAEYVETHTVTDWAPLWKALNATDPPIYLAPCDSGGRGNECSAEMIVVARPEQIIVLIENEYFQQAYLQYRRV